MPRSRLRSRPSTPTPFSQALLPRRPSVKPFCPDALQSSPSTPTPFQAHLPRHPSVKPFCPDTLQSSPSAPTPFSQALLPRCPSAPTHFISAPTPFVQAPLPWRIPPEPSCADFDLAFVSNGDFDPTLGPQPTPRFCLILSTERTSTVNSVPPQGPLLTPRHCLIPSTERTLAVSSDPPLLPPPTPRPALMTSARTDDDREKGLSEATVRKAFSPKWFLVGMV
jgi:hypothetical protein